MYTKTSLLIAAVTSQFALNVVQAEPMRLSDTQMDTVTAGAINVVATANALSFGQPAITQTFTDTTTRTYTESGWKLEVGYGIAYATACCGTSTAVDANTYAAADGKFVRVHGSNHMSTSPYTVNRTSVTTIVSITPPPS